MGGDSQQKKEFKQQKQKGDQKHKKFAKKSYTGSSMPAQMRPKHKFNKQERKAFKQNLQKEAEELEKRIAKEAPPKSDANILSGKIPPITFPKATKFSELPLSHDTQEKLKENGFVEMTPIQRASLPHSLFARDILGMAKTGSGKTLAFVIPIIETLYRQSWTALDGVGAIILTPTRELATQIFDVIGKLIMKNRLSVGLLIGGKNTRDEAAYLGSVGIIVATPGRLLHHLENSPELNTDNLLMLVLDEADKMLEMGFKDDLDAIVRSLPKMRQTLLFSATFTANIKELSRLSLKSPEPIFVDTDSAYVTPENLTQTAVITPAERKFDNVYAFIRMHLRSKVIVFFATCKEVKFYYECLRQMRPGTIIIQLQGKMNQMRRFEVYREFDSAKGGIVLLSTDIAARGLDFRGVDWVVQCDLPDSVDAYVHRVGRTARYTARGAAMLFVMPSEQKFLDRLKDAKIPVALQEVNETRVNSMAQRIQVLAVAHQEIKTLAKAAIVSYMRSVHLETDKEVFDVKAIDLRKFSESFGLLDPPKLKLGKSHSALKTLLKSGLTDLAKEEEKKLHEGEIVIETKSNFDADNDDNDDDDEFFTKQKGEQVHETLAPLSAVQLSSLTSKKKKSKSKMKFSGKMTKFDDDDDDDDEKDGKEDSVEEDFIERSKRQLAATRALDKKEEKEKKAQKLLKKKLRARELRGEDVSGVVLGKPDDGADEESDGFVLSDEEEDNGNNEQQNASDDETVTGTKRNREESENDEEEEEEEKKQKIEGNVEDAEKMALALLQQRSGL